MFLLSKTKMFDVDTAVPCVCLNNSLCKANYTLEVDENILFIIKIEKTTFFSTLKLDIYHVYALSYIYINHICYVFANKILVILCENKLYPQTKL